MSKSRAQALLDRIAADPSQTEALTQEHIASAGLKRGFAAMDPAKQREIAGKGGRRAHELGRAHQFNSKQARRAGSKGGQKVSANREHMSRIGMKGGQKVSANREHMARIGKRGGKMVSNDKEHMARIGRMGGIAKAQPASVPTSTQTSFDDLHAANMRALAARRGSDAG